MIYYKKSLFRWAILSCNLAFCMSSSFASQHLQVVKNEKNDLRKKYEKCQSLVLAAKQLIKEGEKLNKDLKIKAQSDLNDIELGASSELNKLKEDPAIKLTEQFIEFSKKENVKLFEVESNCSKLTQKLNKEASFWDELVNRIQKDAEKESNFFFSEKAKEALQEIKYCLKNIKKSIKEFDDYHEKMKTAYPELFDDNLLLNNFDESLVAIIQNKRAETQAIRAFTLNRCVQAENLIKLAEDMLPLISDRDASNSLTTTAKFLMLTLPSCAVVVIYYWPSIWKKTKQYQEKIKKRKIKGQN